jgi:hypothetical protein
MKVSGMKMVAMIVSCFITALTGAEDRKEAADQTVDDAIEQERGALCRLVQLVVAGAQFGEGGTVVAMDGHEEAAGVEAVHLDQTVAVGRGSVDDEEDEVVVVVDLCPLIESSESWTASGWNPKTLRRISKSAASGR